MLCHAPSSCHFASISGSVISRLWNFRTGILYLQRVIAASLLFLAECLGTSCYFWCIQWHGKMSSPHKAFRGTPACVPCIRRNAGTHTLPPLSKCSLDGPGGHRTMASVLDRQGQIPKTRNRHVMASSQTFPAERLARLAETNAPPTTCGTMAFSLG